MSKQNAKSVESQEAVDTRKKRNWTIVSGLLAVAALAFLGFSFMVKRGMEGRVVKLRDELTKVQSQKEQMEGLQREAQRILEEQKTIAERLRQQK